MRAVLLALVALLVASPAAGALGVTPPGLVVLVDAPLLAPVRVETPGPAERQAVAHAAVGTVDDTAHGQPPPPEAMLAATLDHSLHLVRVDLSFEPPRVLREPGPTAKLARLDRGAVDAPARVPILAPRALDAPLAPRALPHHDDAMPPRMLSGPGASAPAPPAAPAPAPGDAAPPAPAPSPPWPALAVTGAALLAPLALALYHRLRGRAAARSQTRRALLAQLAADPGASPTELARAVGVDPSTAQYHLRRLEREGLAVTHGAPRAARWFPAGAHSPDERARLVAERSGAGVLAAVRAAPGRDKSALARELAISRAAVAWHLAALERAGLVRYERAGRCVLVHPTSF